MAPVVDKRKIEDEVESVGAKEPLSNKETLPNKETTPIKQTLTNPPKRNKPTKNKRKYKVKDAEPTSPMGVLQFEIKELLHHYNLTEQDVSNDMSEILNNGSVEALSHRIVHNVEVLKLLSNGDGIAMIEHPFKHNGKQLVVIPFGLPGDIVNIKVFKSHPLYVESDLLDVIHGSNHRNDDLINCKYFGKCSGCQYQSVEYNQQLNFKRNTIENAYKFFAPKLFGDGKLPKVDNTEASPIQYGYRTKLTPHFNIPNKKGPGFSRPSVGFGSKGRPTWRETSGGNHSILDIEECSIGTSIINKGMANQRAKFETNFNDYKKGATILLRENTRVLTNSDTPTFEPNSESSNNDNEVTYEKEVSDNNSNNSSNNSSNNNSNNKILIKTCVTNSKYIVTEYINGFTFKFSAGEFFQNNNSILPIIINYVKSNLILNNQENYLVDAYCGSGLFSITCSENVKKVIGVEVSADSVKFAEINAKANNIQNTNFIVGKAEQIFASIDTPNDKTSVILDPPRKGCDDVFLNQLSDYTPARIVYISCNVHSQARDVEWFINNTTNGHHYGVDSIKGFDFFPQTHHVESVAVLSYRE